MRRTQADTLRALTIFHTGRGCLPRSGCLPHPRRTTETSATSRSGSRQRRAGEAPPRQRPEPTHVEACPYRPGAPFFRPAGNPRGLPRHHRAAGPPPASPGGLGHAARRWHRRADRSVPAQPLPRTVPGTPEVDGPCELPFRNPSGAGEDRLRGLAVPSRPATGRSVPAVVAAGTDGRAWTGLVRPFTKVGSLPLAPAIRLPSRIPTTPENQAAPGRTRRYGRNAGDRDFHEGARVGSNYPTHWRRDAMNAHLRSWNVTLWIVA